METKCNICQDDTDFEDFCQTCLDVLSIKYPNEIELEEVLQWHKNHTKELNKED